MAGLLRVAAGAAGRSGPAAGRLSLLQLRPAHGGRPRACRVGGGLAAASADLPWPGEPHLVLRHAITVLREQRGDGHIAALQAAGLDPGEALVSFAAIGAHQLAGAQSSPTAC